MSEDADTPEMKPTCLGEAVLFEIIKQTMIRLEYPKIEGNCVFSWSANAVDQIEATIENFRASEKTGV